MKCLCFFSPQSVPKNTKSEVEISPDNEVLDLLSTETPPAPPACQGETNEPLTSLDKVCKKVLLLNCWFSSPAINVNSFMDHAISVHFFLFLFFFFFCIKACLSGLLLVLKCVRL